MFSVKKIKEVLLSGVKKNPLDIFNSVNYA
jgi:hypothetical protein